MSHTIGQAEQDKQESNSNSNQSPQDSSNPGASSSEPVSKLSDADYEFLFNQLLEGIAHGWHDRRIIKFFNQLGDRGQQADWVAWLSRLRGKLLKLPIESKRQLGTIMIRFGELTQSVTEVNQIGAASHRLGRELLFGDNVSEIWEYVGPDLSLPAKPLETEQELSERLPSDFATLGKNLTESEEVDAATASSVDEDNNAHDELDLALKSDEEKNSLSEAALVEQEDTFSETLVSADELWAGDLDDLSSGSAEADISEPAREINLDLDLDLPDSSHVPTEADVSEPANKIDLDLDLDLDSDLDLPDNSDRITGYDEEFEFESDRNSTLEADTSSTLPQSSIENPGVAADLQPELPISASTELVDAIRGFDLSSTSQSLSIDEFSANSPTPNVPEEPEQQALSPNYSAIEQQDNRGLSSIDTKELDDPSLEVIESWFNLGLKQVSAGEYSKAIASWDKALSINANLPEAWHNRGSALGRLGDYQAAVKSFQNALEIDPDNYQAWNDRAHALYQLEDWSRAVESWTRAIQIMPGNHLFWYNRGCSLEQLSKWSEAISSYEKALEIKPDFQPGRSRYINLVADNSRPN